MIQHNHVITRPTPGKLLIVISLVFATLMLVAALPAKAAYIFPPDSNPYFQSYNEWATKWWRWALSIPASHHPLTDTADCSTGQSGPVWFLGGSFTANATVVRNCTIPFGKSLFIPVLNVDCSTLEGAPFHGGTEQELRDCARALMNPVLQDPVHNLFCTIDGVRVQHLERFRSDSTLFAWSLLDDDILGLSQPAGTLGNGVGDGVHLLLAPLPTGRHVIHFGGTFPQLGPFTLDITYNITVMGVN